MNYYFKKQEQKAKSQELGSHIGRKERRHLSAGKC